MSDLFKLVKSCIVMKTSHYHGMQYQLMDAISTKCIFVLSVSEKECLAEILLRLITGVVDVIEHQMKG